MIQLRDRTPAEAHMREWRSKQLIGRVRTTRVSQDDVDYIVAAANADALDSNTLVIGQIYFPLSYHIDMQRTKVFCIAMTVVEEAEYLGVDKFDRLMFKYSSSQYIMYFPADQSFGFDDLTEGVAVYQNKDGFEHFLSSYYIKYTKSLSSKVVHLEMLGYDSNTNALRLIDSVDLS